MSDTVEPIKTLPLVFDEPRGRRKPPPHLADPPAHQRLGLDAQGPAQRRAKADGEGGGPRAVDERGLDRGPQRPQQQARGIPPR